MRFSRKQVLSLVSFFVLLLLAFGSTDNEKSSSDGTTATTTTKKSVNIKEPLNTTYFAVTVNSVNVKNRVRTGNQFADLKPEAGSSYLILNTTFKNIDNESRMLSDGAVIINYNGKDYNFDKSETVMLKGWGILMEQLNPLTSITTNLVYKIPAEISGQAYYYPGRSASGDRIYIGEVKGK